jgi:SAM-dependent methyltransferase
MQELANQFFGQTYFEKYRFDFDIMYPFFHSIAATLVEKYHPSSVLDLGCGKGHMVYAFDELGVESFGVDFSEYAVSRSPQNIRERLFKADLASEVLPFENGKFDMITAMGLLEHLKSVDHAIGEMKRVLQPGGSLFIRTPKRSIEVALRMLGISDPTHINVRPRAYWVKTFESQGFQYVGEFPKAKHRKAMWAQYAQKQAIKKALSSEPPGTDLGRILLKFGKLGKWLRAELASCLFLLPREAIFLNYKKAS